MPKTCVCVARRRSGLFAYPAALITLVAFIAVVIAVASAYIAKITFDTGIALVLVGVHGFAFGRCTIVLQNTFTGLSVANLIRCAFFSLLPSSVFAQLGKSIRITLTGAIITFRNGLQNAVSHQAFLVIPAFGLRHPGAVHAFLRNSSHAVFIVVLTLGFDGRNAFTPEAALLLTAWR